jgi:hypothetical protein
LTKKHSADINLSLCLVSARVKGAPRPLGERFIVVTRRSKEGRVSSRKMKLWIKF